ncbi:MAG: tetratricopeptide repeat protein [bacterium]|nr:tetratricopeptide repeat protein [bacterium]
MASDLAKQSYSRRDIRRLAKATERQLRSWEKLELIPPLEAYGFRDLVAIRTLVKLRKSRVSTAKIRSAVAALREKLDGVSDPLVELRLFSDGKRIRVQVGGQTMEPVSGQLLLGFEAGELRQLVEFPNHKPESASEPSAASQREKAEHLFQIALELEHAGMPLDAIEGYRRVLEIDPHFAGALVNLGTIFFSARDLDKATEYYTSAILSDPTYALAHFNLGNLYDEQGNRQGALAEYVSAIRLQPTYADAHYNIALLYQASGEVMRAVRHWKTYLKLDPTSPWATIARRELKKLLRETVVDSTESGG